MTRLCIAVLFMLTSFVFSQDHLLITEIVVTPTDAEFVEIYNPTQNPVDLSNYYLTDATFSSNGSYYYNIVTSQNAGGGSFADFHARFPDGAVIQPGEYQTIALAGDSAFFARYGALPTYELYEDGHANPQDVPDMREALPGLINNQGGLTNTHEVVILYHWDGQSDLVEDVDYLVWGNKDEAVDKTGVSIDGPDPGSDSTTYLDDTPILQQIAATTGTPHSDGRSLQRFDFTEYGETNSGGNGITGHDETSEDLATSFREGVPTPNTGAPASDPPVISNVSHTPTNPTSEDTVTVSANVTDDNQVVSVVLFYSIDGINFDSTAMNPAGGNSFQASILPQPVDTTVSYFIRAVDDDTLTTMSSTFAYTVISPPQLVSIADIQADPSAYTLVTIEGIVTLGAGVTITTRTDAYVQDTSGRGINIFSFDPPDPLLERGNLVRITGTVTEFQGVTEITDYTIQLISTGNPVPDPLELSTQQANNTDLEGTYIKTSGTITSIESFPEATNITLDDGSGEVLIRIWGTTGINLGSLSENDPLTVQAVMDIFNNASQLIPGYQDEIIIPGVNPGDGSGTASIDPDSVGLSQTVTETITIQGESPYTLATISIQVPSDWQWSGGTGNVQLSGSGFSGATVTVQNKLITISSAAVTFMDAGIVTISQLTSPDANTTSTFLVKTATDGGTLLSISNSPMVKVGEGGPPITPIANIQANPSPGEIVTIEGVVTLGAGVTITTRTDAYVQDNSGRGINIFSFDPPDPLLVRGNRVRITGTVEEFQGVTEITNYTIQLISTGNELPEPLFLSTQQANNVALEGTYIRVKGLVTSVNVFSEATNLTVDDGSGDVLVRVWGATGINVGFLSVGDSAQITAVMDIFSNAAQLIPGYQDEVIEPGRGSLADGSGTASLSTTTAAANDTVPELSITLLGTTIDTIRTVRIDVPIFWDWSQELLLSEGGFQNASSRIHLEEGILKVTIEDAAITLNDTGVVTFKDLLTPEEPMKSVFWIQTAGRNGTLRYIASNPVITVGGGDRYWIYDLQTNSANFSGSVTVRGVTTIGAGLLRITSAGGTPLTTAYIQDESGRGINLFRFGVLDTAILYRGNYVEARGPVTEFQLTTELEYTSLDSFGPADLPEAVDLTNAEVNSAKWDGTLIRTNGVVIEKFSAGGGTTINISDGSGSTTIRVWDTANLDLSAFEVNNAIIVSGVGGVFVSSTGDTIYQILSVYEDQIQIDPNYQPSLRDVFLRVDPYPFVPDRGEKIGITYNAGAVNNKVTIRIFDLGGRLINTFLSENATIIQRRLEWDGRNQLRDLVPLGTYICHLEVVEQNTGEKKTAMAPIVVGTILKR